MTATRRVGRPAMDAASVDRLRDEVVTAAARCFAEHGANATSIDDIAAVAGVSRATVYRYAGGRDELIVAVTMRRFDEWVEGVLRHARRFDTAGDIIAEAIVWTSKTVRSDPTLASLFDGGTAMAASRVFNQRSRRSSLRPPTPTTNSSLRPPTPTTNSSLRPPTPTTNSSPTESWRQQFGRLLESKQDELRPGIDPFIVADRVLSVMLERLARPSGSNQRLNERKLRDWIDAWLLPAVLDDRPPLPDSVRPAVRD